MKRMPANLSIPLRDYRLALQAASPAQRLGKERSPYFVETRRWHPSVVAGALIKIAR